MLRPKYKVPVLMYHRVEVRPRGSMVPGHYCDPNVFAGHMRGLRRLGYRSVSLADVAEAARAGADLPPRKLVISFDDGYENFHSNALPALIRNDLSATVFVVSDLIGGDNEWDNKRGDVCEPLMSLDQLLDSRSKGIELGSHTRTHADLLQCDPEAAWDEIEGSKRLLEERLNGAVRVFCYPYGHYNREVRSMVERAGYVAACSTKKGVVTPQADLLALGRINVRSDTTLPVLLYKIVRGLALGR